MLSGKLGRLGKLLVQSYQQPFAKPFTLLKLPELLKLTPPFPGQIKLQALEPPILLGILKLAGLLKLEKRKAPFLNQIKTRLLNILKQ